MQIRLNPEQRTAVEHGDGPLLVLAGAGSGKTRVLTARVARLIETGEIPPHRILAVTFTNKAASEMRERIETLTGGRARGLWIGTFHSVAARLLRREAGHSGRERTFTIYDEDDSLRGIREAMETCGLDPRRWSPRALRSRISSAKNALVGPSDYAVSAYDLLSRAVADVYPAYQKLLSRRNAYDFDDLLFDCVQVLERVEEVREKYSEQFLHVLVDEYQDTNHAQYRMIKAFAGRHENVCVVGDDDQSIYGWRGADLRNILDFERDFPGAHVVRLERNYRSTASILQVANAVIACNVARKPKSLRTEREAGEPILVARTPNERREASWVTSRVRSLEGVYGYGDCAVLYRTNAQSRAFEEAFRRAGLPYRIVGGVPFYERREIKDVIAYLRLAVNPDDDAAFTRAVGWPRRGVGDVTLDRLREEATGRDAPLLKTAASAAEIEGIPAAARRSLVDFAERMSRLREEQGALSARVALESCVKSFGLATALAEEEDGADRLENVSELFATASSFDRAEVEDAVAEASDLELYLQTVALRSEIDDVEFDGKAITLMTLHNAKGLEFPVVFLAGLEEGLFPLSRALDSEGGLEEERRLFYVGVTRAMDRLHLTYADRRWRAGTESRSSPSSFLDELPDDPIERRLTGGGSGRRPKWSTGSTSPGGVSDVGSVTSPWAGTGGGRGSASGGYDWRRSVRRGAGSGAPHSTDSDELQYDYSDTQVPLELEPGARIVHPRFGEGRVLTVSGAGREAKAEIEFEEVGTKKVVVAYAGLRPA
jgi:DNA helicase-2/ATP-dependent DNA helicase PcrA